MSLFAGNVSLRASPDEIRSFFSKFGPCRVDVKRGYAFIDYDNSRDAEDARNDTNGKDFYGMKLNVEWSKKHIARTSGLAGPSIDWERRRTSRYADDRRPRDYDRDYDRDYRRRYDSSYDRDRYDRDRDYDRRYRDRDDFRYDRGRDREWRDRYERDDYGARDYRAGRGRERGRELGYERRRYEEHEKSREGLRDGGDERGPVENNDTRRREEGERPPIERRENGNGNGSVVGDKDRQNEEESRNGPSEKAGEREEGDLGSKDGYREDDNRRRHREDDQDENGDAHGRDGAEPKRRRLNDEQTERNDHDHEVDRPREENGENRRTYNEDDRLKDGPNRSNDRDDYGAENGTRQENRDRDPEDDWEKDESHDFDNNPPAESRKEKNTTRNEYDRDDRDGPANDEEAAPQRADDGEDEHNAAF
eukprot:TRINITY_DN55677_c0_g1_i1.p4 TRINITY_DN55677_c0_g1~~TRINITY_DN55677_c0_g1_i1.p4  ORF type:complete len:421 (-),score=71.69 TRINITY_DN55677_c0_g1_i1:10745-12007(-)